MRAGSFIFCDSQLLVRADAPFTPAEKDALDLFASPRTVAESFVMRPEGVTVYALAGEPGTAPDGYDWVRLRMMLGLGLPHTAAALRALGLLNWRESHRFCGCCGGALEEHAVEVARVCPACGHLEYPGIAPAVIVRVEKDGKILLAHHVQRIPHLWTCLAGYVELGESLEDCVRREVREEAGIEVGEVRYAVSQYWPYPNQMMVGFVAQWQAGELKLQASELTDARWFHPSELPDTPPKGTMAWRLIHGAY